MKYLLAFLLMVSSFAALSGCGSGDVSEADAKKLENEIKKGNEAGMKDQNLPPGDGPTN